VIVWRGDAVARCLGDENVVLLGEWAELLQPVRGRLMPSLGRRLVEAGHKLTVFDTRKEAVEALTKIGADICRHRARACEPRGSFCNPSPPAPTPADPS